jgi:Protein NO VEIN, C-terminal
LSQLSFERLFSMGAFDGLRSIRAQALQTVGLDLIEVVELIRSIDPDAGGLDFEAALALNQIVGNDASLDEAHLFYRCCILQMILAQKTAWARSITLGRDFILKQLSRDEHQCFRSARLLDAPPPDDVVEWWYILSAEMRQVYDQSKMDRARKAEKLTFDHEIARLARLGIAASPRWVAVDNNTAGYDILSYDPGEFGPVNRLIEVKSTIVSPLRFHVTRNEWEQAQKAGTAYQFHIWDLGATPPQLHERAVAQVQPHIPSDQRNGRWTGAEIPVL